MPSYKGSEPFECWSIDLVTHLKGLAWTATSMVVVVCQFSKWVDVEPLPYHASSTITCWLYFDVVCYYGTPKVIRCNCGGKLQEEFEILRVNKD